MAEVALFITESFLKKHSNIDENVDTQYITPVIELVQDMYILPVLGTALYDEIAAEVVAGSVSTDNQTLLDSYVQKTMLYYVLAEGLPSFNYKIENKSVATKTSDNAQPVGIDIIRSEVARYKNLAEVYAQRTTNYLKANSSSTKYNNYNNAGSDFDTIHPKANNYFNGWELDNSTTLPEGIEIGSSKYDCT